MRMRVATALLLLLAVQGAKFERGAAAAEPVVARSAAVPGRTGPAPYFNDIGGPVTHHVALAALAPTATPSLVPVLGPVEKELTGGKPVFRSELDFLYSNVLYDPAAEHPYRVYYFPGDKSFPPTPGQVHKQRLIDYANRK